MLSICGYCFHFYPIKLCNYKDLLHNKGSLYRQHYNKRNSNEFRIIIRGFWCSATIKGKTSLNIVKKKHICSIDLKCPLNIDCKQNLQCQF